MLLIDTEAVEQALEFFRDIGTVSGAVKRPGVEVVLVIHVVCPP